MKNIEEIAHIQKQMGYSDDPIYEYKEFDYDLMSYSGSSEYSKKFNLTPNDILIIMKVITESAAYQRGSQKSMMATKSSTIIPPSDTQELKQLFKDSEALIQTRQTHQREVADISKLIANGLGLNNDFAYLIGLLHDIGHTWNGHTGERILSAIGRLKNCGYIVHNAMGAYILERENIIDRAIDEIKQFNPKANEQEIRNFMKYVIDGVVSHNGEGVIGKISPNDKTFQDMADEIKKCFTEKGYDKLIMPATMEGAVIRYADIIAYTRSDILDGFRLKDVNGNKIISEFDDEYLSIIGTCLARQQNFKSMLNIENKFLLELSALSQRIKSLSSKTVLSSEDKLELERTKIEREAILYKYKEFEKYKIEYAKDYVAKIQPQSDAKNKVTSMIQNVFIMDLVETSKDKKYITMSPLMRKTLFALRDLNVRKIVPYTRRIFETENLPIAANNLVDIFSNVLIETGIAYSLIPEEAPKYTSTYSEEMHEKNKSDLEKSPKSTYERKLYHYYTKQNPKNLSYIYENVIEAMIDIAKHDISIALGREKYDGELKEVYEATKISPIKRKIGEMGKTSETITAEDEQKLLLALLEERQLDIEKTLADKMAIEYIGGMTDTTILAVLIEKNLISRQDLIEGYGRAKPGEQREDVGVKKLQATFSQIEGMIDDDDLYIKRKSKNNDEEHICL